MAKSKKRCRFRKRCTPYQATPETCATDGTSSEPSECFGAPTTLGSQSPVSSLPNSTALPSFLNSGVPDEEIAIASATALLCQPGALRRANVINAVKTVVAAGLERVGEKPVLERARYRCLALEGLTQLWNWAPASTLRKVINELPLVHICFRECLEASRDLHHAVSSQNTEAIPLCYHTLRAFLALFTAFSKSATTPTATVLRQLVCGSVVDAASTLLSNVATLDVKESDVESFRTIIVTLASATSIFREPSYAALVRSKEGVVTALVTAQAAVAFIREIFWSLTCPDEQQPDIYASFNITAAVFSFWVKPTIDSLEEVEPFLTASSPSLAAHPDFFSASQDWRIAVCELFITVSQWRATLCPEQTTTLPEIQFTEHKCVHKLIQLTSPDALGTMRTTLISTLTTSDPEKKSNAFGPSPTQTPGTPSSTPVEVTCSLTSTMELKSGEHFNDIKDVSVAQRQGQALSNLEAQFERLQRLIDLFEFFANDDADDDSEAEEWGNSDKAEGYRESGSNTENETEEKSNLLRNAFLTSLQTQGTNLFTLFHSSIFCMLQLPDLISPLIVKTVEASWPSMQLYMGAVQHIVALYAQIVGASNLPKTTSFRLCISDALAGPLAATIAVLRAWDLAFDSIPSFIQHSFFELLTSALNACRASLRTAITEAETTPTLPSALVSAPKQLLAILSPVLTDRITSYFEALNAQRKTANRTSIPTSSGRNTKESPLNAWYTIQLNTCDVLMVLGLKLRSAELLTTLLHDYLIILEQRATLPQSAVLCATLMDNILDLFSEDDHNTILHTTQALPRLEACHKQLLSVSHTARKQLEPESTALLQTALENVPAFILYKRKLLTRKS